MIYLLDTNVVSELRKAKTSKANKNVMRWVASVPSNRLFISVITVLELEMGILSLERKDEKQGKVLRQWFSNHVLPTFQDRILEINTPIALRCAKLHVPDPKSERDAMIAATALNHGMTIATRNTQDFKNSGVHLLNPWD